MSTEKEVFEEAQAGAPEGDRKDLSWYLDKIWTEIKDISTQIEQETRKGGRIARLRFDLRGVRRDLDAAAARIGHAVYEAQMAGGKRPALARIEGYDELFEKMVLLQADIEAKQEEIAELKKQEDAEAAATEA
jgi:cell division protein FtsB